MTTASPLVAVHRLPSEVDARVRQACLRAGARAVASDAVAGETPALLVAHLPRRARRIPTDVLDLASRIDAATPLLLACDEALVHPATSLCLGGVTLVEHAASERLYSQIRIALAAARPAASGGPLDENAESAGAHWWMAAVSSDPATAVLRDESLSMIVPLGPRDGAISRLAIAHEIAVGQRGDLVSSLVECLGDDAGLVHLSREARSWVIYWPPGAGGLWLYSSHRLPHLSELSRTSDVPRILRSAASPGEIVLATTRALGEGEQRTAQGMADGGPATLDRLSRLAVPTPGFVVEVR